jgi:hypothetical protein
MVGGMGIKNVKIKKKRVKKKITRKKHLQVGKI